MTINLSSVLLLLGSSVILVLGAIHLVYTWFSPAFEPRDRDLGVRMRKATIVLTPDTTLWLAWIGFNASHGLGAALFGLIYGYLAVWHHAMLVGSGFLTALALVVLGGYATLAWRYWFRKPLIGICTAMVLFAAGLVAV